MRGVTESVDENTPVVSRGGCKKGGGTAPLHTRIRICRTELPLHTHIHKHIPPHATHTYTQ